MLHTGDKLTCSNSKLPELLTITGLSFTSISLYILSALSVLWSLFCSSVLCLDLSLGWFCECLCAAGVLVQFLFCLLKISVDFPNRTSSKSLKQILASDDEEHLRVFDFGVLFEIGTSFRTFPLGVE